LSLVLSVNGFKIKNAPAKRAHPLSTSPCCDTIPIINPKTEYEKMEVLKWYSTPCLRIYEIMSQVYYSTTDSKSKEKFLGLNLAAFTGVKEKNTPILPLYLSF